MKEMTNVQKRVARWFGIQEILDYLQTNDKVNKKLIGDLDEENCVLKDTVARLQEKVNRLQDQVQERMSEVDTSAQMMEQMKQQSDKKIAALEANIYTLRSLVDDRNNEYKELLRKYHKLNNSYVEKEDLSIRQDEIIKNMQDDLRGNADIIETLKKNVNELKANNDEADDLIKTQNETINELQDHLRENASTIEKLIADKKECYDKLVLARKELTEMRKASDIELVKVGAQLEICRGKIDRYESQISRLQGRIGGMTKKMNRYTKIILDYQGTETLGTGTEERRDI